MILVCVGLVMGIATLLWLWPRRHQRGAHRDQPRARHPRAAGAGHNLDIQARLAAIFALVDAGNAS